MGGCKGSKCLDGRQHFVHILVYYEIIICYQCPELGHFLFSVGRRHQIRLVLAKSSEIYYSPDLRNPFSVWGRSAMYGWFRIHRRCGSGPGPVHDNCDPYQADQAANEIETVRGTFIYQPAPQQREHDEYSPVCGVDPAKVSRLEGGDDSVEEKDKAPNYSQEKTSPVSQPEPDQVTSSYFKNSS